MAAFSLLGPQNPTLRRFIGRLGRSRFFTISVALHFVLVLVFGSVVLVRQATRTEDVMDSTDGGLVQNVTASTAPDPIQPVEQAQVDPTTPQPVNNAPSPTTLAPLSVAGPTGAFEFSAPAPTEVLTSNPPSFLNNDQPVSQVTTPTAPGAIPPKVASAIKGFTQSWVQQGDSGSGVGRDRKFKFTAFLAKYSGGDWDSTVKLDRDGKITKGSLPNFLYFLRKLSNDKIQADPDPVPLDIASDELFTKKPPFVLFTGHQDFRLTDKEVENLQKYLQLGGCVWGDSSLPGLRSRFDIAFRREMKRVLPDQDIQWQELPASHDLFNKKYWKEVVGVPPGLNYYQEPVYALKNFGEVVVVYTANDYCDMWQVALDEKMDYDLRHDEKYNYNTTNIEIFHRKGIYFRNLELPELRTSYKFGTNIVLHLLTRWEDKLRNVPTGL